MLLRLKGSKQNKRRMKTMSAQTAPTMEIRTAHWAVMATGAQRKRLRM